jgi:hypothetical protein
MISDRRIKQEACGQKNRKGVHEVEEQDRLLQKIEIIRDRMDVSYREAREALEEAGGSVVDAIILLEDQKHTMGERLQSRGSEVVDQIKGIIHKGNVTKIKIKKGDKILAEIPATLGALGVAGALASTELAVAGALGIVAALTNKWTIEVERAQPDQEQEHLS